MAPFRSLIIRILLEQAIAAEEYSYGLYESLLRSSPPPGTARILKRLAAAELEHRIKLLELQEDPDAAAELLRTEGRAAEELPDGGREPRGPGGGSGAAGDPDDFRHLLMTALEKEHRAVRRYRNLAARSRIRTAKEVFTYLMRQEMEHEAWISGLLEDLE